MHSYQLTQQQQFIGINAGINFRSRIINRLNYLTGFHVQGSIAFVHNYKQQLDSNWYKFSDRSRTQKMVTLPNFKGKNFFQWQAMVPLGLEAEVLKQQLFLRAEFIVGLVGGPYRPNDIARSEAHGFGLWLIYQPKHNIQ